MTKDGVTRRPRLTNGQIILLGAGGVGIVLGVMLTFAVRATAGVTVIVFGLLIWVFASVVHRTREFEATRSSLKAKLDAEEHGPAFAEAAIGASDSALEAVIPLLRDVASEVVALPERYGDKRLADPDLQWIRQELHVQVFAVRRPGDEHWIGGGRITDMHLPDSTELALAGDQADIDLLKRRLARHEQ